MQSFTFAGSKNPRIVNPTDPDKVLKLYSNKRDLEDYDTYTLFVNGVKSIVRKDERYTKYKEVLYNIGLDHCQWFGNISKDMAPLEMHHGPIFNLFEICSIVTDHLLKEDKSVNSFMVADEVLSAHERHEIGLVMLCETAHEAAEAGHIFLPYKMMFGKLDRFLKHYKKGLTKEHFGTLSQYLKLSDKYDATDNGIFELIERVKKYIKK